MDSSHFTNGTSLTAALSIGRGGRSCPIGKFPLMLLRTTLLVTPESATDASAWVPGSALMLRLSTWVASM